MDEKITYILEIRSPYKNIKQAISDMFEEDEPLYIAKNENNETSELEYIADITKIKALDNGFVIHVNSKEQITEIKTDD
tara:strand:+ start:220 stop:456 length:237 start_codon:yes stop_codon:yes gene_type:complete